MITDKLFCHCKERCVRFVIASGTQRAFCLCKEQRAFVLSLRAERSGAWQSLRNLQTDCFTAFAMTMWACVCGENIHSFAKAQVLMTSAVYFDDFAAAGGSLHDSHGTFRFI